MGIKLICQKSPKIYINYMYLDTSKFKILEIFEDLFPHLFRQTCKLAIVNITPVRFGNGSSGGHIFSKMTIKIKINIFGSFQNSSMVKLARLRENDIKSHLLRLPTINCLKLLSDIIFLKHLAAQNLRRGLSKEQSFPFEKETPLF